jgi:endonuclease-3 related protein
VPAPQRRRVAALLPRLLDAYGPQGWWPLRSRAASPGFDEHGYHAGDYREPTTGAGRFEVMAGAVLTQNTAWRNVEPALDALLGGRPLDPRAVAEMSLEELAERIRTSGYFRQKARKLRALAEFIGARGEEPPSREELLGIWGIGPETADSILLYAFRRPYFVVDAYTRRLLSRLAVIGGSESYGEIQRLFVAAIPPEAEAYNELHALVVRHAKEHCRSAPRCAGCPISRACPRRGVAPGGVDPPRGRSID